MASWVARVAIVLAVFGGVLVSNASALNRTTTLLSKPTGVADPNTAGVFLNEVTPDGSRVLFSSDQKLTPDDTDTGRTDVYERSGAVTRLVSKPTGLADPDTGD